MKLSQPQLAAPLSPASLVISASLSNAIVREGGATWLGWPIVHAHFDRRGRQSEIKPHAGATMASKPLPKPKFSAAGPLWLRSANVHAQQSDFTAERDRGE